MSPGTSSRALDTQIKSILCKIQPDFFINSQDISSHTYCLISTIYLPLIFNASLLQNCNCDTRDITCLFNERYEFPEYLGHSDHAGNLIYVVEAHLTVNSVCSVLRIKGDYLKGNFLIQILYVSSNYLFPWIAMNRF